MGSCVNNLRNKLLRCVYLFLKNRHVNLGLWSWTDKCVIAVIKVMVERICGNCSTNNLEKLIVKNTHSWITLYSRMLKNRLIRIDLEIHFETKINDLKEIWRFDAFVPSDQKVRNSKHDSCGNNRRGTLSVNLFETTYRLNSFYGPW